ncbi:hypothetical protein EDC01DRAFT_210344 [Geopyxis carbonaria]|nr:hypothetical protein EDC01DRAFT_210344 [Geopyxis carbonaria]
MNPFNTRSGSPPRPEEPEDFYRSSSTHLPIADTNHYHPGNSVSPTDSQAPIMRTASSQYAESYHPPTATADSNHEPYFPPPPTIPEVNNYRTSMGVVNGEVGASIVYPPPSPINGQDVHIPVAPLSAGLKTPRTPGTTKEEMRVQELEEKAQFEDKKDLAVKLKVRLAKVVLRSVNCACSLVVLALVASTFAIFYSTRHMATRNNLPPWAVKTPQWPQIVILVIACISLILSLGIMYSYWKGGHNRAERAALHATIFAGAVFIFTIAIWSMGIGIMQGSRADNNGQDIWGWACKDNTRRHLFQDAVNYALVCRQQDWVVVCAIIEISVEALTIAVYLFAFYRLFYTKRKLRKSMNVRDEARSSLWLAKLQQQRDVEEGHQDPETSNNTAYNQLTTNTTHYAPEKQHTVPILQAPPPGHAKRSSHVGGSDSAPLQPPAMPAAVTAMLQDAPKTSRSVSFQAPPPGSSGSR